VVAGIGSVVGAAWQQGGGGEGRGPRAAVTGEGGWALTVPPADMGRRTPATAFRSWSRSYIPCCMKTLECGVYLHRLRASSTS